MLRRLPAPATTMILRRARISRRLSRTPPRRAGFSFTTRSHRQRRQGRVCKQALENYNFFGAPHVAIIHTDEPLGIYGRDRLRRLCLQFHAGGAGARPRHYSAGGIGAPFRTDPPPLQTRGQSPRGLRHFIRICRTTPTRSIATAHRGRASRIPDVRGRVAPFPSPPCGEGGAA